MKRTGKLGGYLWPVILHRSGRDYDHARRIRNGMNDKYPVSINQYIYFLYALLALLCCSNYASGQVYVNRELLPPTETDDCPFTISAYFINSETWDGSYQNAWGECADMEPGGPFILESSVFVEGELRVFSVTVNASGLIHIGWNDTPSNVTFTNARLMLDAWIQVLSESTLEFVGGTINVLGGNVIRLLEHTSLTVAGTDITSSQGPLFLLNGPGINAHISHSNISVGSDDTINNAIAFSFRGAENNLTIIDSQFQYTGGGSRERNFVFINDNSGIPGGGGLVEIRNSVFDGANGTALHLLANHILEDNQFLNTTCTGVVLLHTDLCGYPVAANSIHTPILIRENTGSGNLYNGIRMSAPRLRGNVLWSTTPDLPIVASGVIQIEPEHQLSIASGTALKFIWPGTVLVRGRLHAENVVFTSINDNTTGGEAGNADVPLPGDWGGIRVEGLQDHPQAEAILTNCTIRYAGQYGGYGDLHPRATILRGANARLELTGSTISHGSRDAIRLVNWSSPSDPTTYSEEAFILGNVIHHHFESGIHIGDRRIESTISGNSIYGNETGIRIGPLFDEITLTVNGNYIAGNMNRGIDYRGRVNASALLVNNIIAANGSHGIEQANNGGFLRILNNTIYGNGGDGVRFSLSQFTANTHRLNNLITHNAGAGIRESVHSPDETPNAPPLHNNIFGNALGIYALDISGESTVLSINQLNAFPGAAGNISGDPLFSIAAQGISASIRSHPEANISVLTSVTADFTTEAFAGLTLNPNTEQQQQFLIIENTSSEITVLGDISTLSTAGNPFIVTNLLPLNDTSPNIDAGIYHADLPLTDFAGNPRIFGAGIDIGAYEFQGENNSSSHMITQNTQPHTFYLAQNYPNPFNPVTTIRYHIPDYSSEPPVVRLEIFDLLARHVAVLVDEQHHPGIYDIQFNASSLASGIYYYRLITNDFVQTKKMLVVK